MRHNSSVGYDFEFFSETEGSSSVFSALIAETENILQSTQFIQSKRAQRFLRYVVDETIAGRGNELKERTIGVVVFERSTSYDTGNDAIVRVTANDVRKRMAQYYQNNQLRSEHVLELIPGTYIPRLRPTEVQVAPSLVIAPVPMTSIDEVEPVLPQLVAESLPQINPIEAVPVSQAAEPPSANWKVRTFLAVAATLLVAALVSAGVYVGSRSRTPPELNLLWSAYRQTRGIVLCIGSENNGVTSRTANSSKESERQEGHTSLQEAVLAGDALSISSLAEYFGQHNLRFRLHFSQDVTRSQFRHHPIILYGGLTNTWTLRFTKDLPYTITPTFDAAGKVIRAQISDAGVPSDKWSVDYSVAPSEWNRDYAIVARYTDPSSDDSFMIMAGLGRAGDIGATEIFTNEKYLNQLKAVGLSKEKSNFEAVISMDINEGQPAPPKIEAVRVW